MVVNLISPRSKKISLYSDLYKDLTQNPTNGDLALRRDEESVKESIKNLILTDKGERLMQPLIGGNIRAMLFENITPAVLKMIEEQIFITIEEYEPRAELIDVEVKSTIDDNKVEVTIRFYITNIAQPIQLKVFLERIR
jgi:phage baseplate assembly protein W